MSFLKAEWRKLALANYVIDPSILEPYLPLGTQLDLWNGRCYVSLVGFMFLNTRVLGIKVPWHVNFEEVNLRFYVTFEENNELKRGVVFVKEIVPKPIVTFVANRVYREHYQTLKMDHVWTTETNQQEVEYRWRKNAQWNRFQVIAETHPHPMEQGSETEFITEHYWGYSQHPTYTIEYEVTHPKWDAYRVLDHSIELDFGQVYGADFSFLNHMEPVSVMLAEGSAITVESRRKITF